MGLLRRRLLMGGFLGSQRLKCNQLLNYRCAVCCKCGVVSLAQDLDVRCCELSVIQVSGRMKEMHDGCWAEGTQG